jgi:hypothetical protein
MTLVINGKPSDKDPDEQFPLEGGADPIDGSKIEPVQLELPTKPKRKFKRERNYSKGLVKRAGKKLKGGET